MSDLLYHGSPSPTPLSHNLSTDLHSVALLGSLSLEPRGLLTALLWFRFRRAYMQKLFFSNVFHWKDLTKLFGTAFIMWVVRNSVITWSTLSPELKAKREQAQLVSPFPERSDQSW